MLVIVNPKANGGRAQTHWERVRPALAKECGSFQECVTLDVRAVRNAIQSALNGGEEHFVAAGGDGTVNLVVGLLVEQARPEQRSAIVVGAVGLGSSNDFHKMTGPTAGIGGFPCRLNFAHPIWHDVGRTTYLDETGALRVRHWVINASVGTTAWGNWIYNEERGLIGSVKRCSSSLAIVFAALRALLGFTGAWMTLRYDDGPVMSTRVRNLGVVKNPNFTGCLRYDSPYEPGSGDFFVHLLAESSLWDTVVTLARLARGRFAGRPTAHSRRARRFALDAANPFAVEGDGEIVVTRHVEFSLEPLGLQVCA